MQQIKRDLGDDAVIINSRNLDDGTLRVTAAVDENPEPEEIEVINPGFEGIDDPAALFGGIKDYGALPTHNLEHTLDEVSNILVRHNVPGYLQERIMARAGNSRQTKAGAILGEAFAEMFPFDNLPDDAYERPMMLVGQPGAGKTTTIAKLAARAVLNGLKPVVITCDNSKAGAVEQLAAFLRVLNLGLIKVNDPAQLKQALNDNNDADQIYIDCPGLNAFDPEAMKELFSYTRVMPMDLIVTIPGGMDMEECTEIARAFAVIGARWLLPTRIDMTRRLGGILAAADAAKLAFAGMGNKPDIATGFAPLDAATLAELFLPKTAGGKA